MWTVLVCVVSASVLTAFPDFLSILGRCGLSPSSFRLAALCSVPAILLTLGQPVFIWLTVLLPLWWFPWRRIWAARSTTLRYAIGSLLGASGFTYLMQVYAFQRFFGIQSEFVLCIGWFFAITVFARRRDNRTLLACVSFIIFQAVYGLYFPVVSPMYVTASLWLFFLFQSMITLAEGWLKLIISRFSSRWI